MNEVMRTAEAVRRELRPDRLNYTCFGNAAPHVHFHIIPRRETDPDWGKAPWRENEAALADDEAEALAGKIAERLQTLLTDD
jgi:diadenosine tetraphosphate (Ap4A) HIT family hydrolase